MAASKLVPCLCGALEGTKVFPSFPYSVSKDVKRKALRTSANTDCKELACPSFRSNTSSRVELFTSSTCSCRINGLLSSGRTAVPFSKSVVVCCTSSRSEAENRAPIAFTEEFKTRTSADEVRREILACYDLVHKLGRGAVYLGSARTRVDHPHYVQAMELGCEVARLLNCTSWTGVGPGLMDAVVRGAMQAGKPVAGFKISKEAGEWTSSNYHPYLPDHTYMTCRFFSARKHGLVDAGVRNKSQDKTAFVALPGGVGTLDEIFEVLTLIQLGRIGSSKPVPFLVMNYDGFYSDLLRFLDRCGEWGTISVGELDGLWKCFSTNSEALDYLADFYEIDESNREFRTRLNKRA